MRPRTVLFRSPSVAALVIAALTVSVWGCRRKAVPEPLAAAASVEIEKARPVTQDLLDFNPQRKMAGCAEIAAHWMVAPTRMIIMDGPEFLVLLDEHRVPVKVIERHWHWQGIGGAGGAPREVKEYTVAEGRLTGKAARWVGTPLTLFTIETYRDNVLDGPTDYFAKDGQKISSCDFRRGVPWTGRALHRDGFDQLRWEISYESGQQNGPEVHFAADGSPERLRTFRMGTLDGLQRGLHEGRLRHETIYENGVVRQERSWHDNGQLEASGERDAQGKQTGQWRRWDREGRLLSEENYRRGKYHGWRWEEGHGGLWWWENEVLNGKAAFDERTAKEAAR